MKMALDAGGYVLFDAQKNHKGWETLKKQFVLIAGALECSVRRYQDSGSSTTSYGISFYLYQRTGQAA